MALISLLTCVSRRMAKWFGLDVFWVNRLGHPFEEIGESPNFEGTSLTEVLAVLNLPEVQKQTP